MSRFSSHIPPPATSWPTACLSASSPPHLHHRHVQSHCHVAAGLPEPSPAITVHHPVDHLQSTASTTTNRLPRSAFDSPSHIEVAQHPAGLPGPPQGVVFSALSSCPPPPLGYIPIRGDVVPTHHLVSSSQPYRI